MNKITKMTKLVLILITLPTLLATAQKLHAKEDNITVEGVVQFASRPRGFVGTGNKITFYTNNVDFMKFGVRHFAFKIILGEDGQWSLELSPIVSTSYPLYNKIQKICQAYDKTNIYTTHYSEGVLRNRDVIGTTNLNNLIQFAEITPGSYPPNELNFEDNINVQYAPNFLWLALCSSDYFKNKTNNTMPLPWSMTKVNLRPFGFRYDYEPLSITFPIPKSIRFVRDTRLDLPEEQEINRPEVSKTTTRKAYTELLATLKYRKTWYPDAYIIGKYITQQTTNINGITIPTEFELETFDPEFGGVDDSLGSYKATVTKITSSQDGLKLPLILATLTVNDYRFHKMEKGQLDKITYTLDNTADWPDQNDPKLKKLFENADTHKFNPAYDRIRNVILGLLFVLTSVFFLTYLFFFRKIKSNQQ
jgi:hypothetical protein